MEVSELNQIVCRCCRCCPAPPPPSPPPRPARLPARKPHFPALQRVYLSGLSSVKGILAEQRSAFVRGAVLADAVHTVAVCVGVTVLEVPVVPNPAQVASTMKVWWCVGSGHARRKWRWGVGARGFLIRMFTLPYLVEL